MIVYTCGNYRSASTGVRYLTIDNFKKDVNWSKHVTDGKSDFKEVLKVEELESNLVIREWLLKNDYKL